MPATHWAAKQIGVAAAQGWIAGYPDGTFRPEKGLTRAEACTVVNRMLGRTGDAAQANKLLTLGLFSDMTAAHWAAVAVAEAIGVPHPGSGQRRRELERCGPDKDDLSDRVPSGGRSAVLRGP